MNGLVLVTGSGELFDIRVVCRPDVVRIAHDVTRSNVEQMLAQDGYTRTAASKLDDGVSGLYKKVQGE